MDALVNNAADGVRVNAVCPGVVDTPLVRRLAAGVGATEAGVEQELERMALGHAFNRLGTPDEIAQAIFFLASPEASFITGAILAVDGGYTAW